MPYAQHLTLRKELVGSFYQDLWVDADVSYDEDQHARAKPRILRAGMIRSTDCLGDA